MYWSGSRRVHGDLGRLDRGPHRRALDETELAATAAGVTSATSGTAPPTRTRTRSPSSSMLCTCPAETLRGLPVGRSRCSATERVDARPRARRRCPRRGRRASRRSASSMRVAVARCRGAGSRRRARRRSSSAGGPRRPRTCRVWTTAPCSRMTRRSASAAASSGSWVTSSRTPAERSPRWLRSSRRTAPARALVERGERLVEEQQPRFGGDRTGERDPLGLPARRAARGFIAARSRPGRRDRATAPRPRRAAPRPVPRLRSPNATFSSTERCGKSR